MKNGLDGAVPRNGEEPALPPLHAAAEAGDADTIRALVAAGVDPGERDDDEWSPLEYAAVGGHVEAVRALLAAGADAGAADDEGFTALHRAAWEGHAEVLVALCGAGADVNAEANVEVETDGDAETDGAAGVVVVCLTPLRNAAAAGHVEAVRALLAAGANVDAADGDGQTALHRAAGEGHAEAVVALLGAGAGADAADGDGRRALHCAAEAGHSSVVRLLVEGGSPVHATTRDGWTALHAAAAMGHPDAVVALLTAGASVDAQGGDVVRTSLHLAALAGHADVVPLLVGGGAQVDARDSDGWTPLHMAAEVGHAATVVALLGAGADVDAADGGSWTPLRQAAANGHAEAVRVLLAAGANANAPDAERWTPLHAAAEMGHAEVVVALLGAGAHVNAEGGEHACAPLHLAASAGQRDVVPLLVGGGAHVGAHDSDGWTALHYTADAGHLELAQLLLSLGADPSAKTSEGKTALSMARSAGHGELVALLRKTARAMQTPPVSGPTEASPDAEARLAQYVGEATAHTYSHAGQRCVLCGVRRVLVPLTPDEGARQGMLLWLERERGVPREAMHVDAPLADYVARTRGHAGIVVRGRERGDEGDLLIPVAIVECAPPGPGALEAALARAAKHDTRLGADVIAATDGCRVVARQDPESSGRYEPLPTLPMYEELVAGHGLEPMAPEPAFVPLTRAQMEDPDVIAALVDQERIGEESPHQIAVLAANLHTLLRDDSTLLGPGDLAGVDLIADLGWCERYARVAFEPLNARRAFVCGLPSGGCTIVSLTVYGCPQLTNDPAYGNRASFSGIAVAIHEGPEWHHVLELRLERYTEWDGDTVRVWNSGDLTVGRGKLTRASVLAEVAASDPSLVVRRGDGSIARVDLGSLNNGTRLSMHDAGTRDFLSRVLRYALIREEIRDAAKRRQGKA